MDMNTEMLKFRLLLGGILLFLVSLIMSCSELKYRVWGQTADGTITGAHMETDRHGQKHQVVEYIFMDGQTSRREYVNVDPNQAINLNAAVKVQYIPGKERQSRILGDNNMGWVTVFGISVIFLLAMIIWVCRKAYQ
jgi:hypothetical protein